MRASAKMDIGALKADQLGHAQTCLRSKPKQRVVTPSGPSRPLGDGKQCVQLWFSQERNESSVEALGRNGEHTLDYAGVFGMAKRGVAETTSGSLPVEHYGCALYFAAGSRGGRGSRQQ